MPPKTIRREVTHFGVNFLTGPLVRLPIQLPEPTQWDGWACSVGRPTREDDSGGEGRLDLSCFTATLRSKSNTLLSAVHAGKRWKKSSGT
jgi:hypothetical protein